MFSLHKSRHGLLITLFFALALTVLITPAFAQDGAGGKVTDDDVNEIAREVYCPVCENTPLDVCQTQACADWRDVIRTQLTEGKSEQEIYDYFANLYGDRVLAEPPRRGLNLILWLVPLIAIPLGAIFFSRYLQGLKETVAAADSGETTAETAVTSPKAKDDYIQQIEEELKRG